INSKALPGTQFLTDMFTNDSDVIKVWRFIFRIIPKSYWATQFLSDMFTNNTDVIK
ncbi:740_t:CDS:1, partial [Dentiscutata erythropus]